MKSVGIVFQILAGLVVLGGAGFASYVLFISAPKTKPENKKPATKIVQTIMLLPTDEKISVTSWGTVIPAREVMVQPQVSGRITGQSSDLVPGGLLAVGENLVQIDREDYELALTDRVAELEQAQFDLELESGRQLIAKREWEQLQADIPGADMNPALALRKPHLKLTEAMVEKAENAIRRAELDLSRTVLQAPFNCMVVAESVETGQLVDKGSQICRLVGTDQFWVRATLPTVDLKRIQLPGESGEGAGVEVYLDTGNGVAEKRHGRVVRLLADLEEQGRMARVLVEIEDPLQLKNPATPDAPRVPLLLGSYVKVEIEAGRLTDVLTIPRKALREGNRLWLVGPDKRIRIAEPQVLWTRAGTVLIPNILKEGERLIVSELKSALPGMEVNPQPLQQDEFNATSRE